MGAVQELDSKNLEDILLRASLEMSQPALLENFITPFMQEVGKLWQEGTMRIYHEHLVSTVVHKFLADLLGSILTPEHARTLLVTTPAGQLHEIGDLVIALTAAAMGWRVLYLGSNLPAEEIAAAAQEKRARLILLSILYPADDPHPHAELLRLDRLRPDNITIIAGGAAAKSYQQTLQQINAIYFTELKELRAKLISLQGE